MTQWTATLTLNGVDSAEVAAIVPGPAFESFMAWGQTVAEAAHCVDCNAGVHEAGPDGLVRRHGGLWFCVNERGCVTRAWRRHGGAIRTHLAQRHKQTRTAARAGKSEAGR